MRITGGTQKGKTIQTVKGQDVRPTSSKVRESIFNIIQLSESGTIFYEGETIMLDLFAGSGIMGLEALSRGTKKAVFVEKNPRHCEIIKKNAQMLRCHSERPTEAWESQDFTEIRLPRRAFGSPRNDKTCGNSKTKIINADALKILDKIEEKFNCIFIDPPYASELYEPVLKKIRENKILSNEGFIILEHSSNLNLEKIICETEFKIYKTKIYGDTGITIILKNIY